MGLVVQSPASGRSGKRSPLRGVGWTACAALMGVASAVPASATEYSIVKLGAEKGYTAGIDSRGDIAVSIRSHYDSTLPGVYRHGKLVELSQSNGEAVAVDDAGDVLGNSYVGATLWPKGGDAITIPPPEGKSGTAGAGMNRNGLVIGYYRGANGENRCFTWTRQAGSQDLPTSRHVEECQPTGVNARGEVVGWVKDLKTYRAFLFKRGRMHLLPIPKGSDYCEADAINKSGDIVGVCNSEGSEAYSGFPVLWHEGKVRNISPPASFVDAYVEGINASGAVVAELATTCCDEYRPAIYTAADGWLYLSDLVSDLANWKAIDTATGINDDGVIAATGTNPWNQDVLIELVPTQTMRAHVAPDHPGDAR